MTLSNFFYEIRTLLCEGKFSEADKIEVTDTFSLSVQRGADNQRVVSLMFGLSAPTSTPSDGTDPVRD